MNGVDMVLSPKEHCCKGVTNRIWGGGGLDLYFYFYFFAINISVVKYMATRHGGNEYFINTFLE